MEEIRFSYENNLYSAYVQEEILLLHDMNTYI